MSVPQETINIKIWDGKTLVGNLMLSKWLEKPFRRGDLIRLEIRYDPKSEEICSAKALAEYPMPLDDMEK